MEDAMTEQEMINYLKDNDLSNLIRTGEPAEVTPPAAREIMAVRTVRLPTSVYDELLKVAEEQKIGTSVLMRQIIEQWVATRQAPYKAEAVVPVAELVEFLNRTARPAA